MDSLLQASGNTEAIRRVESLRADSSPLWGGMTCAQMYAHCQKGLELAAGELRLKRSLIGVILGGYAKRKYVLGEAPFAQSLPTDPTFRIPDEREFEREQGRLVELVRQFGERGALAQDPHPFFGPLTPGEWDRLMWKHLDHHLRQFGA